MHKVFSLLCVLIALTACQPSAAQIAALRTDIAAEIYATLTAQPPPPTSTPTLTPSPTVVPTATLTPTATALPSPTLLAVVNGVIISNSLNFRSGPGKDFPVVVVLKKGDTVKIIGQVEACAWLKAVAPDGSEGWLSGDAEYIQLDAACDRLPRGTFRLLNGTLLLDRRRDFGLGQLTVENSQSDDALVVLTTLSDQVIAAFYVQASNKFTLTRIPDGVYRIYVTTGREWDGESQRFTLSPSYRRFDSEYAFSTTPTQYTAWSISLQAAASSADRSTPIDAAAFPLLK